MVPGIVDDAHAGSSRIIASSTVVQTLGGGIRRHFTQRDIGQPRRVLERDPPGLNNASALKEFSKPVLMAC